MRYTISNTRDATDFGHIEAIGKRSLPLYYSARNLGTFISDDGYTILKMTTDTGHIVGFMVVESHGRGRGMHIKSFAVDEKYRGGGLGTAMLRYIQQYQEPLTLYVDTDNTVAYNCYVRNGFVSRRTIPGYYQSLRKDAYLMVWSY